MNTFQNKSKETNTFRFKTFSERVNEIDIRKTALYYIGHKNEELLEENETYFHQTIKKWITLNLTDEFKEFSKKCLNIITLPQLIHKKDFIIDFLLEKLSTATTLSLQPLLEIIVVLGRDLREEFYSYFQRILDRLICLLNTKDADQLEWTLICLAFLFKTLKPFLKKNISIVFNSILPLLDEQRYSEQVTNFAVECFAFIVRDIRDNDKLLEIILKNVENEGTQGVQGCGRLFFEIIRGVNGQFHSCARTFFQFLFDSIYLNRNYNQKLLNDIIKSTVQYTLSFIHSHNMSIFWLALCQSTENSCLTLAAAVVVVDEDDDNSSSSSSSNSSDRINHLIDLLCLCIEYKNGKYLNELDTVVSCIIKLLDHCRFESVLEKTSTLICSILLSSNAKVSQLDTSRLCKKILTISYRSVFEKFVWSIVDHQQFDILILPGFLKYFEHNFDKTTLELLVKIILKKSPALMLVVLKNQNFESKKYSIQFKSKETIEKLFEIIENYNENSNNLEEYLLATIILSHSVNVTSELRKKIENHLERTSIKLSENLNKTDDSMMISKQLFFLSIIIENLLNNTTANKLSKKFYMKISENLLEFCLNEKYIISLKILNFLLINAKQNNINITNNNNNDFFNKIHLKISNNFLSPYQDMRIITASILTNLNNAEENRIYEIFNQIENIELTVQTYRKQILLIQQFQTDGELFQKSIIKNQSRKLDCLKMFLGLLHYNFKLLWEPILKTIEDLSLSLDHDEFWIIYKMKLDETASILNGEFENPLNFQVNLNFNFVALNEFYENHFRNKLKTKIDYNNYRNLLWSKLSNFNNLIEIKNHDIVTIFLKFIKNEYKPIEESKSLTLNLLKIFNTDDTIEINDDDDDLSDENNDDDDVNNKLNISKHQKKHKNDLSMKNTIKTLSTKLQTFSNQSNPKQMHRESELYQLYLDLLSSTNIDLQKLALDCIFAYKTKSLIPYKDHLYNLIDEKQFKNELINLNIQKDNGKICNEHRTDFMPICLRILYGKMITKSSSKKNMSNQVRKGIVLRFLGNCEKSEIEWFLKMAFGLYDRFLQSRFEDIPDIVRSELNFEKIWSPKKLQSSINLLELIRKQFAGLMDDDFLIYILKLIVFVGCVCQIVIDNNTTVVAAADTTATASTINRTKILIVFKNVKNRALSSLVNFFQHFENFQWTEKQIEILTNIYVWPNLEKLPQDSIHSPTPLLKLLCAWSENYRHFLYLNQCNRTGLIPFKYVIKLLLNDKAKPIIRKTIMEMIERLLMISSSTTIDIDNDNNTNAIDLIISANANSINLNSNGIQVIKPYISDILKRLKINFNQKRSKRHLDKRDLNILSMLTHLVDESNTCDSLLQLLLPILISNSQQQINNNHQTDEIINQIIQTLSNLINKLDEPEQYIRKISPLFEQIQDVQCRKMLCQLLIDISMKSRERCPNLLETSRIITNLNAWDKRWIEQPDYDKRLDALKLITEKLNNNQIINIDFGILIIYNCFYFIKYDKDMGMRDNASEHLKILLPKLIKNHNNQQQQQQPNSPPLRKDFDYLINDIILDLIRRTIRDTNDKIRNEGILLLGELSKECKESHEIFKDLSLLNDYNNDDNRNNDDNENDFFENVTHLQSYRHGKGLLRFCSIAKNLHELPNLKTLTQFLLPLTTRYLLNEKYANKHTLIDAAIETIGCICQLLPWQHYQAILKYYLQKMRFNNDYQKQCVRIVVAILDSFHFDLSNANSNNDSSSSNIKHLTDNDKSIKENNDDDDEDDDNNDDDDNEIKDEDLDSELNEFNINEITATTTTTTTEPIFNQITCLSHSTAKKVIQTIQTILIPTLNHSITEKTSYDLKHKLNRKRFSYEREEEEILRVPIALALVKLLQKLPKQILNNSLSGIFMKVCTFLKSPLKSVRMLTRDILKKIMLTLGTSYLSMLIKQLTSLLTRGFQVHVLSVTIHGVLDALKEQFQPNDIESCLTNILNVSLNDIFGEIQLEKEIDKITAHTPEAKPSAKSYLTLYILARNISESCLLDILIPFKQYLTKTQSKKTIIKIQDCFQKIVIGLVDNNNIKLENLIVFIYGTISESITELIPGHDDLKSSILNERDKEKLRRTKRKQNDCYLIQEGQRSCNRSGIVHKNIKTNSQANAHVLIEFGLEMLHIVLKRKKLIDIDYKPLLNPLLPILKDSMKSSHVRITTFTLKCLSSIWNSNYQLSNTNDDNCLLNDIIKELFNILHKYSTYGAVTKRDDNYHFVKSAFKAVVALLRNCKEYQINIEHIQQLLFYIEHDINESDKQPIAFSLLKSICNRKIQIDEIHDIMQKLCEISIVSQSDYVRNEIRQILMIYLMEYPLKSTKIDSIIKFYTRQLNYEICDGRLSAMKFLKILIRKFPQEILIKKSEYLFLTFGMRMINEEFPECRIECADCLEQLLGRLDINSKQKLFDLNLLLLENNNVKSSMREMSAILFSRFVNQEKHGFLPRVKFLLPVLVSRLTMMNPNAPGRFVLVKNMIELNNDNNQQEQQQRIGDIEEIFDENLKNLRDEQKQKAIDHEIIQIQNCILKIFEFCQSDLLLDNDSNNNFNTTIDELAYESQKLLGYEHEWVRLNSIKILCIILSNMNCDLVGQLMMKTTSLNENLRNFIYWNPNDDLKSLILDLCAQMQPGETNEQMIEEIVKIFIFIANMLKTIPIRNAIEKDDCDGGIQLSGKINLNWLLRRLRYVIHGEISKAPHSCILRTSIFNWIEALVTLLEVEIIEVLAQTLLSPLVREMSEEDQNIDPKLRQLAIRVGNKIRKRIGSDIYDKLRASIQTKLMIKRADRRKQLAQEKINDPIRAAKRKQGVSDRKKLAKKRKMDVIKGKVEGKKKRKRKMSEDIF